MVPEDVVNSLEKIEKKILKIFKNEKNHQINT